MNRELKVCPKCHLELPIAEFVIVNKARGYRRAHCRACESARVRAYYAASPEYRQKTKKRSSEYSKAHPKTAAESRRHSLKHLYGITVDQYEKLLRDQDGKCALCLTEKAGRGGQDTKWKAGYFMVDHCHANGHVRGLLCHSCNTRLGSHEALMREIGEVAVLDYMTRPSPVLAPVVIEAPKPRYVEVLPHKPVFVAQPCSIEGCGHEIQARGLCQMHYARLMRRDGDVGGAERLPHTSAKGSSHSKAKLTEDDVRAIRASSDKGVTLAAKYGVTATLISNIRKGKVWQHVGGPVVDTVKAVLTADDVRFIRASELSGAALARQFDVTDATICDIRKGRSWKDVH